MMKPTTSEALKRVAAALSKEVADEAASKEIGTPASDAVPAPATPSSPAAPSTGAIRGNHILDVPRWLSDHGVSFHAGETMPDRRMKFRLSCCPFNAEHRDGDASIFQSPDGKLGFKCFHDSCASHGWQQARDAIGKPDGDHYDPPLRSKSGGGGRAASTTAHGDAGTTTPAPEKVIPDEQLGGDTDPHRLGDVYLRRHHCHPDGHTLRFHRDEYHAWEGGAYRPVPAKEVRSQVTKAVRKEFVDTFKLTMELAAAHPGASAKDDDDEGPKLHPVTVPLVNNVMQAIGGMTLLSSRIECGVARGHGSLSRE